jgi:hypothetical protein
MIVLGAKTRQLLTNRPAAVGFDLWGAVNHASFILSGGEPLDFLHRLVRFHCKIGDSGWPQEKAFQIDVI